MLASLAGFEPASPPSDGSACSISARATYPRPGSVGRMRSTKPTWRSALFCAARGSSKESSGYRTQTRTGSLRLRSAALCLLSYAARWLREQGSNLHRARLTGACPTSWAIPQQHRTEYRGLRTEQTQDKTQSSALIPRNLVWQARQGSNLRPSFWRRRCCRYTTSLYGRGGWI